MRRSWWWLEAGSGSYREYQAYSLGRQERGGSRRLRRGGDASSSAAQPDVGTSLSGLSFIKILFRACRERREREPRGAPCERALAAAFHATINVLSPPPRRGHHTLVRARRGAASSRGHTCCYLFFFVHSPTYVSRRFRSSYLSVRSFVCSFISRGQSKSKTKEGGSVKKTEDTRRHQKTRHLLKCVQKWRTELGVCSA